MKFVKSNTEPIMIEVNGGIYPALITFGAAAELEDLTGKGFLQTFINIAEGKYKTNELLDILYIALKYGGTEIERSDLNDILLTAKEFGKINAQLAKLIANSHNVESSIEDEGEETEKK